MPWKIWAKITAWTGSRLLWSNRVLAPNWPANGPTANEKWTIFWDLPTHPRSCSRPIILARLSISQIRAAHAHLSLLSPLVVLARPNNSPRVGPAQPLSVGGRWERFSSYDADRTDQTLCSYRPLCSTLVWLLFPVHSLPFSPSKRSRCPKRTIFCLS